MPFLAKSKNNDAEQSMHFWSVTCESGKQYEQVVGQRFRMTMAVLDPYTCSEEEVDDKIVLLKVIRGGMEYLLGVLKHGEIYQVNLNLVFDKGENVRFLTQGHGRVHLNGYRLTDSVDDVLNDENGYLCPLVEVKPPNSKTGRKGKVSKTLQMTESESVSPKSKRKTRADKKDLVASDERRPVAGFSNTFPKKKKNGEIQILDFDSDESDEDFSVGDEESESDDDDDDDSDEYLDDEELRGGGIPDLKTYSDDDDDEEEEDEEEEEEEEEQQEIIFDSKGPQRKRKLAKALQPQKRSRNDSFTSTSTTNEKSEDKDSSDSGHMNSSIGNTPMPKKQKNLETSSEKKASKKKKRLSEISNLSEKPVKGELKSPVAESTPNRTANSPGKYPVQRMDGGVEIQDVIVGRGPAAAKGKMVHVFYVGRFQDHTIFDSRLPGKRPFAFKLGIQQVIKGWDVGLLGMRVGGKRKLKIPPSMGYGNSAIEGIPPNSTLFFVVELHAVS